MASTGFKLSKRNGITRRVVFPEPPTWAALATRISELYGIPIDRVAVSYLDADDDEVTLNTEEELKHFYQTCKQSTLIKLFVQDLVTLRLGTSDAGPVPQAYYRINSVGQEVPIEDDWNFPAWDGDALVPEVSLQSSQHGYLEELSSTARTVSKLPSMTSTTSTASAEKGKAKANPVGEVDDLSNISVSGVDPSPKNPPIPYYVGDLRNQDIRSSSTPALAESTPRAPLSEVENTAFETKEPDVQDAFVDDPPLPTIEPQASASLPDDISNFFTSLCSLISSHPEVSESFHNIVRNASNGTYWRRHREALSQAAAEISHSSETVVRDAEAEAGRKVFSALDALFRPFSQVAGARPQSTEPTSSNKDASGKEGGDTATRVLSPAPVPPTLPGEKGTTEAQHDVPKQDRNTFIGRTTDWQSFLTPFPQPISPYAVHIPPVHSVAPGIVPPPPPPPPPPPIPYPPATGVPSPFHPPYVAPITPGTFTPFHMSLPTPASPRHAEFHSRSPMKEMHYDPDSSPPSPAGPYTAEMAELKAKVSVAKSMYRAEKARYLQERHHARRRERGRFRHGGEQ